MKKQDKEYKFENICHFCNLFRLNLFISNVMSVDEKLTFLSPFCI